MNKKHLLGVCLLSIICLSATAQLKVDNEGKTHIKNVAAIGENSTFTENASLSVLKEAAPTGNVYGVHNQVKIYDTNRSDCYGLYSLVQPATGNPAANTVGVLGCVIKSSHMSSKFGAGICGLANSYNGIGVYGGIGLAIPTSWVQGTYAGYFAGSVRMTGSLTAAAVTTTSDLRLKENITNINPILSSGILELNPVSYSLKKDSVRFTYDADDQEMTHPHYGLIAQEVRAIYPNLVYEDAEGYLSINYTELIPLMIQELKQLHEEVAALSQAENNGPRKVATNSSSGETSDKNVLQQSTPNPASHTVSIGYDILPNAHDASIRIYNLNGHEVSAYPVSAQENMLSFNVESYDAGMYLYSLIVDGQIIDTKRMVITK